MNTSPIINTASVPPNAVAPAKQADGNSSDVSFNQRLSREIADRNNRDDAAQTSANRSQDAKPAPPPSPAAAKSANSGSSEHGPVKDARKPDDKATPDAEPSAAFASPEILALVANLTQAAAQAVDPKTAAVASAATDLPALDGVNNRGPESKGAEKLIAAASDKHDLPLDNAVKQLSAQAQPVEPSAIAKNTKPDSEFAAVLNRGDQPNKGLAPTNDKPVDTQVRVTSPVVPPAASAAVVPAEAAPADTAIGKQELVKELPPAALAPLQQAVLDKIQAAAGHPTDKIAPRVGTPAWDQAVGQKVVWMVAGAQQSASMTLNPPDLGPLQIVLNVTNSHADASFFAAQPEVRQALEAAIPKLRELLGDAGIQLGQTTVSTGMPNDPRANGDQAQQGSNRHDAGSTVVDASAPVQSARGQRIVGGQGLVDTFA